MSDFFKAFVEFFKPKAEDDSTVIQCEKIIQILKSMEEGANKLITWSLSITAGSLLAIISDSYLHPESKTLKIGYLLFIAGWGSIAKVIYHGNNIVRFNILSPLHKDNLPQLEESFISCNSEYRSQLRWFNIALVIFGIWLIAYLMWWVFGVQIKSKP